MKLKNIFSLLISSKGLRYKYENHVLKIGGLLTRTYKIDYVNSERQGSSNTDISMNGDTSQTSTTGTTSTTDDSKSSDTTQLPFLGSIPILGKLFSTSGDSIDKTELVIMVKPTILRSSQDMQVVKDILLNLIGFE